MQIHIQSSNIPLSAELRDHAKRRVLFALGRLGGRIRRVVIRLSDINGPRGGLDKHCRIQAQLLRAPEAVVEDTGSELVSLLDRAISRAGRLVSKRIELARTAHRPVMLRMYRNRFHSSSRGGSPLGAGESDLGD